MEEATSRNVLDHCSTSRGERSLCSCQFIRHSGNEEISCGALGEMTGWTDDDACRMRFAVSLTCLPSRTINDIEQSTEDCCLAGVEVEIIVLASEVAATPLDGDSLTPMTNRLAVVGLAPHRSALVDCVMNGACSGVRWLSNDGTFLLCQSQQYVGARYSSLVIITATHLRQASSCPRPVTHMTRDRHVQNTMSCCYACSCTSASGSDPCGFPPAK